MSLFIAGVNHFDPMGREHVANWLCSLADRNHGPPSFVAVEFDESHYRALHAQRPQYRQWIRTRWPGIPENDLDLFEYSLGYEGDTHRECFDGTEVLWLDEGRTLEQEVFEHHVRQRLMCLQFFERRNALMLPGVVSEQVQGYTRPEVFSPQRSRAFADRILAHVRGREWRWAIAITGASHASDRFENSMRTLLELSGIPCEVRYFCRLD